MDIKDNKTILYKSYLLEYRNPPSGYTMPLKDYVWTTDEIL